MGCIILHTYRYIHNKLVVVVYMVALYIHYNYTHAYKINIMPYLLHKITHTHTVIIILSYNEWRVYLDNVMQCCISFNTKCKQKKQKHIYAIIIIMRSACNYNYIYTQ